MLDNVSRKLSLEECARLKIKFPCDQMENGEYRFRCVDETGGWGYALTKMPDEASGRWQNSHYHRGLMETYIVQKGWIVLALAIDGKMRLKAYKPNEIFTTEPGQSHNIYAPRGSIFHTVKHGDFSVANDWFEDLELDKKTKSLTEADILISITDK
jgi:hypothetical protein